MSRIDNQGTSNVVDLLGTGDDLSVDGDLLGVEAPDGLDTDIFTRLSNLPLRPWLLQLEPGTDPNGALLDGILSEAIDPILAESEGRISASIAEMLIRLEPAITATGDDDLISDFAASGDYLRMLEHLRALQIAGPEG
ncbi:MAG: hypothetical protein AAF919_12410 [Pseudomonadota bacterium]